MAKLLKLRRGTTTQHGSFTGAEGEVTIDTTKDTAVVHDGSTTGGTPLAKEDMSNVSSASIAGRLSNDSIATSKIAGGILPSDVKIITANINDSQINNAKIGANAAIAGTKISPNFGSQNITTTGTITTNGNELAISGADPRITFTDTNNNPDFQIYGNAASLKIVDSTASQTRLQVNSDGHVDVTGNLDVGAGIDVTGNITTTGDVSIPDDKQLQLGASDDLILYHQTSNGNSIIKEQGGGALSIQTNGPSINFYDIANSTSMLIANAGGSVDLYHQNNVKLKTASSGVDVTGNISVTGTVDGRDVASDGSKLDGIESGATADQTKADIDALNINADQVDGLHASSFLRSDAADTASGDITFSGGAGAITVSAHSDIRMSSGNWTGETAGKIQHHANHLYFQNGGGNWIFRQSSGNEVLYIDSSGNLVADGNVTAYSDARLKTDISTINDALGICGKLRGVSYKWLKNGASGIGVIAQEVEQVIPEVVLTNVTTDPETGEEKEVKSVDYGKIVGVLINAINELKEEVEELKNAKITG